MDDKENLYEKIGHKKSRLDFFSMSTFLSYHIILFLLYLPPIQSSLNTTSRVNLYK